MSQANVKLAILCTFVFMLTLARMYFGYESWDTVKDVSSALTVAGGVAGAMKASEKLFG